MLLGFDPQKKQRCMIFCSMKSIANMVKLSEDKYNLINNDVSKNVPGGR